MPSIEDRLAVVEKWMKTADPNLRRSLRTSNALEGRPSDATLSLPHNDSWLFEDNVDGVGGFPANLRYVISANVTRVVSARLSIHLAPYRTYNTLSVSSTGIDSNGHVHAHSTTHQHVVLGGVIAPGAFTDVLVFDEGGTGANAMIVGSQNAIPLTTFKDKLTAPGSTDGESATHTHNVSASGVLGVTEGATATGVTISFDGVDHTADLGGPFNSDQIELDVRAYLAISQGVWHAIAMKPAGLGRIEAHLRLGVYVAAGSVF
jgi:hypothetical protein